MLKIDIYECSFQKIAIEYKESAWKETKQLEKSY